MRILNVSLLLTTAILSLSCGKSERSPEPVEEKKGDKPGEVAAPRSEGGASGAPAVDEKVPACPETLNEELGEACVEGALERGVMGLRYSPGASLLSSYTRFTAVVSGDRTRISHSYFDFRPADIFPLEAAGRISGPQVQLSTEPCGTHESLSEQRQRAVKSAGGTITRQQAGRGRLAWVRFDYADSQYLGHVYLFEKNPATKDCALIEVLVASGGGSTQNFPDAKFEKGLISSVYY